MSGFLGAHALLFYCRLSLTYTIIDLGLIEMKRIFNIVSIIRTTTGLRLLLDLISIGKRALLLNIPSTTPKIPFPPFSWKGIRVSKPIRGFLGGKKRVHATKTASQSLHPFFLGSRSWPTNTQTQTDHAECVAIGRVLCDAASQVSAVADDPARRAVSRVLSCTHKWTPSDEQANVTTSSVKRRPSQYSTDNGR